ncbi:uncharacterized protein LOC108851143 [Raphanus sativus]|uniref:Uncharacterized protein LOC108851143 n=1 Tax=Raphanus sativus TaxID=3726 RepID=A0A6J0N7E1_RAPSA|nr:uncharacterized protein LOC108851143 [Raphanus sativus]
MEKAKLPFKKRFARNGSSIELMVDDYMKAKGTRGRFGDSPKVLQCLECKGFGHVQAECTNLQKRKKKNESGTDSDDGEELKNLVAFTTFVPSSKTKSATGSASASVSGSSCGGEDDARSDDDDGEFDLGKNYERLYENWLKQVDANSQFAKEKAKLEAQVVEALKYASEKEEEARQAVARLAETQKGLKMLNGGTKQLDHLLNIGKSDRCGLGYQGECSTVKGVFVSAGKAEVLATSTTRPEVKVSAKKTSNGKTAVKTATDVKNATATHTATPRCFKLLREKNQMVQTYGAYGMRSHGPICYSCGVQGHIDVSVSSQFKELIMEDLITMEMVEWDFLLTLEDIDLHISF